MKIKNTFKKSETNMTTDAINHMMKQFKAYIDIQTLLHVWDSAFDGFDIISSEINVFGITESGITASLEAWVHGCNMQGEFVVNELFFVFDYDENTGISMDHRFDVKQKYVGVPSAETAWAEPAETTPAAEPAEPAEMIETVLTVGLFDKDTCRQEISTPDARAMLDEILLQRYGLYAYTMLDCYGCYTMRAGHTVHEPSIRVEIVTESPIDNLAGMICDIKAALKQESVMVETAQKQIAFV